MREHAPGLAQQGATSLPGERLALRHDRQRNLVAEDAVREVDLGELLDPGEVAVRLQRRASQHFFSEDAKRTGNVTQPHPEEDSCQKRPQMSTPAEPARQPLALVVEDDSGEDPPEEAESAREDRDAGTGPVAGEEVDRVDLGQKAGELLPPRL